jgi:NADPH2:quinone reductase
MNAIIVSDFGPPEMMKYESLPDPVAAAGQVLVSVKAVGVNPVDTYIRSGAYANRPSLPYTPGSDAAGIVLATGPDVTRFTAGDRVYIAGSITGAYAEQALCAEPQVYPLTENLTFAQGAAIGVPYATAYRALFMRGRARAGEIALIHGATGGVGIAAVQLAKAAGLRVIATGGTEKGRALLSQFGALDTIDHTIPGHLRKVMEFTGDKGADIIIEMLANVNLGDDCACLAKQGRIIVIGSRGKATIDARDLMGRDADIRGMTLFNAGPHDTTVIHAALMGGFSDGSLKPVINCEIPLKEAPRAHEMIMKPGALGKIVLAP